MKKVYLLIIAFITALVLPVYAMPTAEGNETLKINKDYNDSALFGGKTVEVNSKINGLALYGGYDVTITGDADYALIGGNMVTVKNYTTKDLFIAGQSIEVIDVTARNYYIAGETITIDSSGKELYVAGAKVTLKGDFETVYVDADEFILDGEISGKLVINEDAKQNINGESKIATTETYKNPENDTQEVDYKNLGFKFVVNAIISKIVATIKGFINLIILGFLTILIFKNVTGRVNDMSDSAGSIFGHFGIGLAILLFIPIIGLILLFTGFASGLGFVALMLYVLGIYLTGVIGSLYLGKILFKNMNEYLRYFLISLILTVIYIIPLLGGLVQFFMLCLSLGIMAHICLPEKKKGK